MWCYTALGIANVIFASLAEGNPPKNVRVYYYPTENSITELPNTTGEQETGCFNHSMYH